MVRPRGLTGWWCSTACVVIGAASVATFAVWFVGFDMLWAVASVLAVGSVGALRVSFTISDDERWERSAGEAPRGVHLDVARLDGALVACDRLTRPDVLRWIGAQLNSELDDHRSRAMIVRRIRALLLAELHDRAPDAVDSLAAAIALFGPDARSILSPSDGPPVTAAVIARCLDGVERLNTEPRKK